MANKIGQVHVKRERGKLTVIGMGQTPRGQRFIKERVVLNALDTQDPDFKTELAAAVKKMLPESPPTG